MQVSQLRSRLRYALREYETEDAAAGKGVDHRAAGAVEVLACRQDLPVNPDMHGVYSDMFFLGVKTATYSFETFSVVSSMYSVDEYGNEYALLTCASLQDSDYETFRLRHRKLCAHELLESLSHMPYDADVYIEFEKVPCFAPTAASASPAPSPSAPGCKDGIPNNAKGKRFCKLTSCDLRSESKSSSKGEQVLLTCVPSDAIVPGPEEKGVLVGATIIQNTVFAITGIIMAFLFPMPYLFDFGIDIRNALGAVAPVLATKYAFDALVAIATLVLLLLISVTSGSLQKAVLGKERQREVEMRSRQGIIGEVLQLRMAYQAVIYAFTGVGEEALFRAGTISPLYAILAVLGMDPLSSLIVSCMLANVAFTVSHLVSYRDIWTICSVFLLGAVLTLTYLVTGGIIAGAIAHGAYDFIITRRLSHKMRREGMTKFFAGKRPVGLVRNKNEKFSYSR